MNPWIAAATVVVPSLLTACVSPPKDAGRDFWGNVYPPECRDLSDISASIIETDHVILWENGAAAGLYGGWTPRYIMIRKGLSPEMRADVVRHERCHQRRYDLTGDPAWH